MELNICALNALTSAVWVAVTIPLKNIMNENYEGSLHTINPVGVKLRNSINQIAGIK